MVRTLAAVEVTAEKLCHPFAAQAAHIRRERVGTKPESFPPPREPQGPLRNQIRKEPGPLNTTENPQLGSRCHCYPQPHKHSKTGEKTQRSRMIFWTTTLTVTGFRGQRYWRASGEETPGVYRRVVEAPLTILAPRSSSYFLTKLKRVLREQISASR